MIRPTRLNIAVGGEHLLPVAKHALLMLRTQMERLKVPTLSRILDVGDGRIEIVANAFGIDTIKIQWSAEAKHGLITWPSSDEAVYGWGKPFVADNGEKINPPLGTIQERPQFVGGDGKQREILFNRKNYDNADTDISTKVRRRFTKQGNDLTYTVRNSRFRSKWISSDKKTVLVSDGYSIFLNGEKVATSSFTGSPASLFLAIAKIRQMDTEGKEKNYFLAVGGNGGQVEVSMYDVAQRAIGPIIYFFRAPYRNRKIKENTAWEILYQYDLREGLSLLGVSDPDVLIGRVCINQSGTEAMAVYCHKYIPSKSSGYVIFSISADGITAEIVQNINSAVLTRTELGQPTVITRLESVPDEYVFDIGYRVDNRVFGKITSASFYKQSTGGTTVDNTFSINENANRKLTVSIADVEMTLEDSSVASDYEHTYYNTELWGVTGERGHSNSSASLISRQLLYANPSDGFVMYREYIGNLSSKNTWDYGADLGGVFHYGNWKGKSIKVPEIRAFIKTMGSEPIDLGFPLIADRDFSYSAGAHVAYDELGNGFVVDDETGERTSSFGVAAVGFYDSNGPMGRESETLPGGGIVLLTGPIGGDGVTLNGIGPYSFYFPRYLYLDAIGGSSSIYSSNVEYYPNYDYFPITQDYGQTLFSVLFYDDKNLFIRDQPVGDLILDIPETYRWVNYLTGNDPVTLSEVTGPRSRFNDITVF